MTFDRFQLVSALFSETNGHRMNDGLLTHDAGGDARAALLYRRPGRSTARSSSSPQSGGRVIVSTRF